MWTKSKRKGVVSKQLSNMQGYFPGITQSCYVDRIQRHSSSLNASTLWLLNSSSWLCCQLWPIRGLNLCITSHLLGHNVETKALHYLALDGCPSSFLYALPFCFSPLAQEVRYSGEYQHVVVILKTHNVLTYLCTVRYIFMKIIKCFRKLCYK